MNRLTGRIGVKSGNSKPIHHIRQGNHVETVQHPTYVSSLTKWIRDNPTAAIVAGIAVGVAFGLVVKRR